MSYRLRPAGHPPCGPADSRLSSEQQRRIRGLVRTYTPDLHDPSAVEVLLIVLEICRILQFVPGDVEQVFGTALLEPLEQWNGIIVYPPGRQPRPQRVRRVWVWRPGRLNPQVYAVGTSGTIRIYGTGRQSRQGRQSSQSGQSGQSTRSGSLIRKEDAA